MSDGRQEASILGGILKKIFAFFLASVLTTPGFAGVWQLNSQQSVLTLYLKAHQSVEVKVDAGTPIYIMCNGFERLVGPGNVESCFAEYEQYLSLVLSSKEPTAYSQGLYEIKKNP